jgi:hypothetical protein
MHKIAFAELRNDVKPDRRHYLNLTKHEAALPILQLGCKMQKRI